LVVEDKRLPATEESSNVRFQSREFGEALRVAATDTTARPEAAGGRGGCWGEGAHVADSAPFFRRRATPSAAAGISALLLSGWATDKETQAVAEWRGV
jgi:hypothetical protein